MKLIWRGAAIVSDHKGLQHQLAKSVNFGSPFLFNGVVGVGAHTGDDNVSEDVPSTH